MPTTTSPPPTRVAEPGQRRPRIARPKRFAAIVLATLLLLVLLVWLLDLAFSSGTVFDGVSVGGVKLGGMSRSEADDAIAREARTIETAPLQVRIGDDTTEVAPKVLGVKVDRDAAVEAAMRVGRTGNPFRRFADWLGSWSGTRNLAMPGGVDGTTTRTWLRSVAFDGRTAPTEPQISFNGTDPVLTKGVPGRDLVLGTSTSLLDRAAHTLPRSEVVLPIGDVAPRWSDDQAMQAAQAAREQLLGKPATAMYETQSVSLAPAEIGALLKSQPTPDGFKIAVQQDLLMAKLRPRFADVGQLPADAHFDVLPTGALTIVGDVKGVGCCAPDSAAKLQAALEQSDPAKRTVTFPKGPVTANVTTANLRQLNVKQELATFTTPFAPGQPRVRNIMKLADILRGKVIRPGEQLSINRMVGERKSSDGWVVAPSINEGSMVKTPGGGISQVATTLYNAAYFAGVQLDEHQPHTSWFARYPKGRDATMGWPDPDLKFTNDLPGPIVIWTSYTEDSVTITLWGTNDGRKGEASEPEITKKGRCEIVKVVRTVSWPDGRKIVAPYSQRYKPENGDC